MKNQENLTQTQKETLTALSSLTGTSFYDKYLENGNTITSFHFQEDFILLDNDGKFIHTSMEFGDKYQREALRKGYNSNLDMIKKEGTKMTFSL